MQFFLEEKNIIQRVYGFLNIKYLVYNKMIDNKSRFINDLYFEVVEIYLKIIIINVFRKIDEENKNK